MGRALTIAAAGLLLLAAVSAASPSRAAAGEGSLEDSLFGRGTQVRFTLGKAPHIELRLSSSGQRVTLEATRGSQSVAYEVAGTVSSSRVEADFGRAGRVSLRFKPSGPPQSVEPFPFCRGKDGSVSSGIFLGTVRFTGFDRFVHFHASRVRGLVTRTPPVHCHFPGGPKKHPPVEESGEPEDRTIALSALSPVR
jgi:hypothetical protein